MAKVAKNSAESEPTYSEPTYSEIVWGQFKKNRIAYSAFWLFLTLFAIAVFAPVISLDQPFWAVLKDESGGVFTVFPWFHSLLLNSNVFGKGIDIFFNLLLVMLPIALPLYLIFRRVWMSDVTSRVRRRRRRRFVVMLIAVFALCFVALLFVQPARTVTRWKDVSTTSSAGVGAGGERQVVSYQSDEGPRLVELVSARFPVLPFSYTETSYNINQRGSSEHILGTDESGRDLFVRMLYGTRLSLTIGVVAVTIYVIIGVILGALAGYLGGGTDILIQRFIEVVMVFPAFILILTFVSFLPSKSIFWIMLIIGVTRWTTVARLVRGEFLKLKQSDFVQAAIAQGLRTSRVIFRHVLPNAMGPVLVAATFGVANAILIEAALSFLGVSDLEAPSWGRILSVGRAQHDLFTMLLPGLAIFFTVSVLNLMGEGLRDALDPKLRK